MFSFKNYIIELCELSIINKRESYYIDSMGDMNCAKFIDNRTSYSLETRQKMIENHYDMSGKNNPFYGKSHSKRVINILKEKNGKPYSFLSPEGKIYKGRNLVEFCKNMKISYDSMYLVRVGRQKNYKGWRSN